MITTRCPVCDTLTRYYEKGEKEELPAHNSTFPFCSKHCKNNDFVAWNEGERRVSTPLNDLDNPSDFEE